MNKNLKILSSIVCGLVLSTGIGLSSSVQAAPAKVNLNRGGISIKAIIPTQTYSYYATINGAAPREIREYIYKNQGTTGATADGIRNILINDGINRIIANNVSYSILALASNIKNTVAFPGLLYTSGMKVLDPGDGTYLLIDAANPSQSYSVYAILTPQDVAKMKQACDEIPKDTPDGFNFIDYYANAIVQKGIIMDPTIARNVAKAVWPFSPTGWSSLVATNDTLLILKGADNTTFATSTEAQ